MGNQTWFPLLIELSVQLIQIGSESGISLRITPLGNGLYLLSTVVTVVPYGSERKGNRKIALTAVKKAQSPANLRSSPNSPVLGDQTLRQYSTEASPWHNENAHINNSCSNKSSMGVLTSSCSLLHG